LDSNPNQQGITQYSQNTPIYWSAGYIWVSVDVYG